MVIRRCACGCPHHTSKRVCSAHHADPLLSQLPGPAHRSSLRVRGWPLKPNLPPGRAKAHARWTAPQAFVDFNFRPAACCLLLLLLLLLPLLLLLLLPAQPTFSFTSIAADSSSASSPLASLDLRARLRPRPVSTAACSRLDYTLLRLDRCSRPTYSPGQISKDIETPPHRGKFRAFSRNQSPHSLFKIESGTCRFLSRSLC
jgi:hypothetical protein